MESIITPVYLLQSNEFSSKLEEHKQIYDMLTAINNFILFEHKNRNGTSITYDFSNIYHLPLKFEELLLIIYPILTDKGYKILTNNKELTIKWDK
jgi:hypothetical protein